jgi:hypothetical protein
MERYDKKFYGKPFRWNPIIDWNRRSVIFKQLVGIILKFIKIRITSKNENTTQT